MTKIINILLFVFILSSCNKSNNPLDSSNFPAEFTALPLDTANFFNIMPLGNLNPLAGHIFPSDHIYFSLNHNGSSIPQVPVYAVGTGIISGIQGYTDGGVFIDFNKNCVLMF